MDRPKCIDYDVASYNGLAADSAQCVSQKYSCCTKAENLRKYVHRDLLKKPLFLVANNSCHIIA